METVSHNKKGLGCSKGRQGLGYQQGDGAARQLHGRNSPLAARSPVSQRPLETLEKLKELKKYNLEEETVQGSRCPSGCVHRPEGTRSDLRDHSTHTAILQMGELRSVQGW